LVATSVLGASTSWRLPAALDAFDEAVALSDENHSTAPGRRPTIVSGNTDLGCHKPGHPVHSGASVSLSRLSELTRIQWGDDAVRIGAGVTIADLVDEFERTIPTLDRARTSVLEALHNQCRFLRGITWDDEALGLGLSADE
jgi:xanthine dehydrogenase iron-sulfur cluster and FAD-binding subunit A